MTQSLPTSRIEAIDVLRGFSLLGIAFVHYVEQYYAGQYPEAHVPPASLADNIVQGFIGIFIIGKFFMIFSFLFGLSFYIQLSKESSANFVLRFAWRLIILFAIGMLHHLHYRGDILSIYAPLGFVLLALYALPDKYLFPLALALVLNVPGMIWRVVQFVSGDAVDFGSSDQVELQQYYDAVKSGGYVDILRANLDYYLVKMDFQLISGRLWITLGLFLLGVVVGRKGYLKNLNEQLPLMKKLTKIGLWTIPAAIVFTAAVLGIPQLLGTPLPDGLNFAIGGFAYDVFNAAMALVYVCVIFRMCYNEKWQKRVMFFYPVGRMGLSIYLMQTLFGVFFFFGIGLGQLNEFGAGVCLLLGLSVYIVQRYFASWWLSQFQYGPAEWLWRSLTYFKAAPMKIKINGTETTTTV